MKKKSIGLLVCAVIVATLAFMLSACSGKNYLKLDSIDTQAIRYDGTVIKWTAVENAYNYDVQIDDGEKQTVTVSQLSFNASKVESFTVKIQANSSQPDVIKSSAQVSKTFVRLNTISLADIALTADGTISWPVVDGAIKYVVSIKGRTDETDKLFYEIPTNFTGSLSVQIKPMGADNTYSYYGDVKPFNKLTAPSNIQYDGSVISWTGSTGASSYEVDVNGTTYTSATNNLSFDAKNKNMVIKVRAIGDVGTTIINSAFSASETFLQLGTVTNVSVVDGVVSWTPVDNATGYKIMINGTELSRLVSTPSYSELASGQSYRISILPYSSTTKHFASWSQDLDVYLLSAPVITWNDSVDLSDGVARTVLTWDGIAQANGYTVKVTRPNGQLALVQDFNQSQRSFSYDFNEIGDYTVAVKTNSGIASGIFDSKYSTAINVTRLPAPTPINSNYVTSTDTDVSLGFTVTFNRVTSASGYEMYKDGVKLGAEAAILTNTQYRVTNVVSSSVVDAQEFNYSIKSVGSVSTISGITTVRLGSSESLPVPISVLAMPTSLNISGFTMSWGAIAQSQGYVVGYAGTSAYAQTTSYNLATLSAGSYAITVASRGNGRNVLSSNYTAVTNAVKLAIPADVRISTQEGGEGMLVYTPVQYASSYDVTIDNSQTPIPATTYSNMYQYITTAGSTIHMVAVANYWQSGIYYISSASTSTNKITRLATPQSNVMRFTNSQFIWNSPSNVSSSVYTPTYQVYNATGVAYNGNKNGTTMDISYLAGGAQYQFRVKAVGDGVNFINSEMSETVSIYKIATPNVQITNNAYVWDGVNSATGYYVDIDGVKYTNIVHTSGSNYSYTPTFTQAKSYTVKVYATGDNGVTSIDCDPITIVQVAQQLATPTFTFGYTKDSYAVDGEIFIQVTSANTNVAKYQYEIAGSTSYDTALYQSHNPNGPGEYTLRLKAVGGIIDTNNVYWIDSQLAGGSSQYKITILATINANSIEATQDGRVKWGSVTGCIRYEYQISINGGAFSEIAQTQNLFYDVSNWSSVTSVTIRVRAVGDGATSISSAWQEKTLYR